jgi:S1-C subfamily serine protease
LALEDGLVLTNAHLVAGSTDDVQVGTGDGEVWPAVVVGFDIDRDLALLGVDGIEVERLELADAEKGAEASIVARPVDSGLRVLETIVVKEFNATGDDIYGEGDVSRRALELSVDVVAGVSGAGVYDADGRLVGIVFAKSRRRDNVAYAVASSEIRSFLGETDAASAANTLRCREP